VSPRHGGYRVNEAMEPRNDQERSFEERASAGQTGLARELFDFLRQNKKWWLTPLLVTLVLVSVLLLAGGAAAPFIYALF